MEFLKELLKIISGMVQLRLQVQRQRSVRQRADAERIARKQPDSRLVFRQPAGRPETSRFLRGR